MALYENVFIARQDVPATQVEALTTQFTELVLQTIIALCRLLEFSQPYEFAATSTAELTSAPGKLKDKGKRRRPSGA